MGASGASRVNPGVKLRRRLQIFVAEELPNQFMRAGIRVEVDFGGDMPELVRSDPDAEVPEDAPLDRHPNSPQRSSDACAAGGVFVFEFQLRRSGAAAR